MALLLQDGTSLLLQDGTDLLLQAEGGGPTITLQPVSQTINELASVTFTVAATGTGTLTYQWYETTAGLLVGETGASLTFFTAAADDGNGYYCEVTDDVGTTASSTAVLTLVLIPEITVDPAPQTVVEGEDATYTVTATGTAPITYQWYETTAGLLVGETASTLVVTTVLGDSGNGYYCIATNAAGSDTSATASLTVNALPVISVQPQSQSIVEQEEVTFSVTASGTGTLTYQWYEVTAGLLIGETASTLVFDVTLADDAEEYYVIVTDDIGSTTSSNAVLTVLPLPVIVTEPVATEVEDGDVAVYTVEATGFGTITYQWYETTAGLLVGETSSTLSFNAFYDMSGNGYYAIVSDDNGGFVQSVTASLTVGEPGLVDSADLKLLGPNGYIEVLPRMKWQPDYLFGKTYLTEQVVRDAGWLMVANVRTTQRAAPQAVGSSYYPTAGAVWDETNFVLLTCNYSTIVVLDSQLASRSLITQVPAGNVGLLHTVTVLLDGVVALNYPFIPVIAGMQSIVPFIRIGEPGSVLEARVEIVNNAGNTRIYIPQSVGYWTGFSSTGIASATGQLNGVASDTAYGIDAIVQGATVSADWDILAEGRILV